MQELAEVARYEFVTPPFDAVRTHPDAPVFATALDELEDDPPGEQTTVSAHPPAVVAVYCEPFSVNSVACNAPLLPSYVVFAES